MTHLGFDLSFIESDNRRMTHAGRPVPVPVSKKTLPVTTLHQGAARKITLYWAVFNVEHFLAPCSIISQWNNDISFLGRFMCLMTPLLSSTERQFPPKEKVSPTEGKFPRPRENFPQNKKFPRPRDNFPQNKKFPRARENFPQNKKFPRPRENFPDRGKISPTEGKFSPK